MGNNLQRQAEDTELIVKVYENQIEVLKEKFRSDLADIMVRMNQYFN